MPLLTGADTVKAVDAELVDIATKHLGSVPAFWGRYFGLIHPEDSYTAREAPFLRARNIRLLPIARQTDHVNRSRSEGSREGAANVDDFISRLALHSLRERGGEILFFLDTEEKPRLNPAYFAGWAEAVVTRSAEKGLKILPAVYLHHNDRHTWQALAEAAAEGRGPRAAWVIAEKENACSNPVPDWDPSFVLPHRGFVPPCPIVARQFALDCFTRVFDFSTVNPDEQAFFMDRLVAIPPAADD